MLINTICGSLPCLETERLLLRNIRLDDLEDMYEYCSIEEVSQYVSWNTHQSISDTKLFLNNILNGYKDEKVVFWGIEYKEHQKLIGTINYLSWNQKHKKAEIAYILSNKYWGKGIMTEAAKEIIHYGFEKMDLVRIEAKCIEDNIGSERVMIKAGMSYEGTLRKGMFTKGKHQNLKLYSIITNTLHPNG